MINESTYRYIVQLLEDGLNPNYVSRYVGVDVKVVQGIVDRTYIPAPDPIKQPRPIAAKLERLKPVSKDFPTLEGLSDHDIIIALTRHGLSAEKIRKHLKRNVTAKSISRYATKKLGPAPKGVNNSRDNQLGVYMIELITLILEDAFGKNRYECELCLEPAPSGCVLHHTKYIGATLYDLMFVCYSCNQSRVNKGLT